MTVHSTAAIEAAVEEREAAVSEDEATCPECEGEVRRDGHEDVCADCGLVVDADVLDRGPECRTFGNGETQGFRRANGGATDPVVHNGGLGSELSWNYEGGGDANLRRWHTYASTGGGRERGRRYGHIEIGRLVSALDLSRDIRERACVLFREAASGDLNGNNMDALTAAALWEAGRQLDAPLTMDSLSEVARADKKQIGRHWNAFSEQCGWESLPQRPANLVPRIVDELGLPEADHRRAIGICEEIEGEPCAVGKSPRAIAAAVVWMVADEVTQAEVGDAGGSSAVTIRHRAREIEAVLGGESA